MFARLRTTLDVPVVDRNLEMSTITLSVSHRSTAALAMWPAGALRNATERWHRLMQQLCDPYRPELHYMRGPGPKWREWETRT